VLAPGVEDERPTVLLDMSLDVKGSVELVLLLRLLMLTAPSAATDIRSLPAAPGYIRSAGRGLRAGGCRRHDLKIDLWTRSP
jgi:hypothetical protein